MRNGSKRWRLPLALAGAIGLAAAGGALAQSSGDTSGSPEGQTGTPNAGAPDLQQQPPDGATGNLGAPDQQGAAVAGSAGTMGSGANTPGQPGSENGNLGGTAPDSVGSPETQATPAPMGSPAEATPFPTTSPAP